MTLSASSRLNAGGESAHPRGRRRDIGDMNALFAKGDGKDFSDASRAPKGRADKGRPPGPARTRRAGGRRTGALDRARAHSAGCRRRWPDSRRSCYSPPRCSSGRLVSRRRSEARRKEPGDDPHPRQVRQDETASTGVSGIESDGANLFYCGGGSSGKIRAVRRPKGEK